MSKVISLRVKQDQLESLQRAARRMGRSPSEAAAILLGEALRQREFAFIEFRDSPVGRQAHLQGTRLAIWQIAEVANDFGGDPKETADHLALPLAQIVAALRYAKSFPEEIEAAIADSEVTLAELEKLIPQLEVVRVDAPSA